MHRTLPVLLLLQCTLAAACAARNGVTPAGTSRDSQPSKSSAPSALRLWPGDAPGAAGTTDDDTPAVFAFLPPAGVKTGAGVVVVPGGGDLTGVAGPGVEERQLAGWLNERGMAAFVVRYRRAPRYPTEISSGDTARAVQFVRSQAARFEIAPGRLGIIGLGAGAALAAATAYNPAAAGTADSADPVARVAGDLAFAGLIHGSVTGSAPRAGSPATFLAGSSSKTAGEAGLLDLWNQLRSARVPVDAHFFAGPRASSPAAAQPAAEAWTEAFYNWVRYRGYLTDAPRVALRGTASLDGRPLPHGYVILTPMGMVGAGPIVGRVLNSNASVPIGQFSVPAPQGPVPGRYRVEVYQNANRWLSNAFTAALTRDPAFGHSRNLSPSIDDLRVYGKVRPTDQTSYVIDIPAGGAEDLTIEVVSGPAPPASAGKPAAPPNANPGLLAYEEQLAHTPQPVPGIPEPILLWPQGAPGAVPDANGKFTDEDKPALYAFPAPAGNNTRTALLVLPGGGFTNRATDQEGIQVARWLNRRGISAFVLRYRIRPNYAGQFSSMDAYRAMRYVRAHATKYGVAADRIGAIGFSAGAELEGDVFFNKVLEGDPAAGDPLDRVSARSNFNVLIYGGRNVANPAAAPPTFMFVTLEDGGNHLAPQINALNGLREAGVPVQAHWYQDGPHGTAMAVGDPQLGQWPDLMVRWLDSQGLLSLKRN